MLMKNKQFESLCKTLLPHLPGFACKGWLLYAEPVDHILRGFCCDGSGFDATKFTVYVFVLPLYVPTNHLYFTFGNRLKDDRGCEKWWNVNDRSVREDLLFRVRSEGLPFLNGIRSPRDLVKKAQELPATLDPYKFETIAYSLAMAEDVDVARQALDRLVKALDRSISWQAEMMERATQLAGKLSTDPQGAKHQLVEWEQATVKNLGLR
jgi:hypothetical protein